MHGYHEPKRGNYFSNITPVSYLRKKILTILLFLGNRPAMQKQEQDRVERSLV